MGIVTSLRKQKYQAAITENITYYKNNEKLAKSEKLKIQLDLWNKEWNRIIKDIPFYRELKRQQNIPDNFRDWDEFIQTLPVIDKNDIRDKVREFISSSKKQDFLRISGGTTGEVFKMPGWNSETELIIPNTWTGLSWYDIDMNSKRFLLWGRAHTLGTGMVGFYQKTKRKMLDKLLNMYRFSAYDLNPHTMRQAALKLLEMKPDYLYGYSAALDHLGRANLELKEQLRNCHLKAIIGTAEAYPSPESKDFLEDLFHCPVGNEYGTVETGPIAYTKPDKKGYYVFWRSYFLEGEKKPDLVGWRVRITSLYPRCFPLVRYDLGDEIIPSESFEKIIGIYDFEDILGRKDDFVILPDGAIIHMSAFHNVFKHVFKKVKSCQVIQENNQINIYYTSNEELTDDDKNDLRERFRGVDEQLCDVPIIKIGTKIQTTSGKTPMIIRR